MKKKLNTGVQNNYPFSCRRCFRPSCQSAGLPTHPCQPVLPCVPGSGRSPLTDTHPCPQGTARDTCRMGLLTQTLFNSGNRVYEIVNLFHVTISFTKYLQVENVNWVFTYH